MFFPETDRNYVVIILLLNCRARKAVKVQRAIVGASLEDVSVCC
jgi:hypothetical protein